MSDQAVSNTVVVEDATDEPRRRNWLWVAGLLALLLLIIVCVLVTPWVYRQVSGLMSGGSTVSPPVMGIRIPGSGSQLDHSSGLPFARIDVHDDEAPNAAGWFDRTVKNSLDPAYIGMDDKFSVPAGWFIERDYSLKADRFVDYMTVKVPAAITAEEIRAWADKQGLEEGVAYAITSVILVNGQECSVAGLDANRVRTNVYVGENWSFQTCDSLRD